MLCLPVVVIVFFLNFGMEINGGKSPKLPGQGNYFLLHKCSFISSFSLNLSFFPDKMSKVVNAKTFIK